MITLKCYELLRNILFLLTKQKYATKKSQKRKLSPKKKKPVWYEGSGNGFVRGKNPQITQNTQFNSCLNYQFHSIFG